MRWHSACNGTGHTLEVPVLLFVLSAHANEVEFTPEVQVRPRYEVRWADLSAPAIHAVSQRSRLGATADRGALSARVVVQDVRLWGEEANTLKDFTADAVDVHIATLEWAPANTTLVTVGRQELALHEHRLIGSVDWTQQGRSFDGGRVQWASEDLHAQGAALVLAEGDSATWPANETAFLGVASAGWKTVDAVYIVEDRGSASLRQTAGVYAAGASGIVSGRIEAYGQLSDQPAAGLVGVRGTVAPEASVKPKITLWWDSLSPRFNTLYATNHKFYGLADVAVFQRGDATTGLHNGALKVALSPTDSTTVKLDGHAFLAADGSGLIGEEVDLTVGAKLPGGLSLAGGGAAFLYADDTPAMVWSWLQINAAL